MVYAQFKKGPKVSKSQTLHDASNVWIYNDLYIWAGWWFETYLIFSIQLGTSSSHLTNSYFSEGLKPPTRNIPYNYIPLRTIKSPSSTALQSHSKAQKNTIENHVAYIPYLWSPPTLQVAVIHQPRWQTLAAWWANMSWSQIP